MTIDLPLGGSYNVQVKGYEVPFGPQAYHIVYEIIEPEPVVTYPAGGETLNSGESYLIQFDTDTQEDTYTVEWSSDGGSSWEIIEENIASNKTFIEWTAPELNTMNAQIRVRSHTRDLEAVSTNTFAVLPKLSPAVFTQLCQGITQFHWEEAGIGEKYEVSVFDGCEFVPLGSTTNDTLIVDGNLQDEETYWMRLERKDSNGRVLQTSEAVTITIDDDIPCPWDLNVVIGGIRSEQKRKSQY